MSYYFTDNTQNAIFNYLNDLDLDDVAKNKLYLEQIEPAFAKLSESLIFILNVKTDKDFDTLKHDCISFLFENMRKFDFSRNTKCFSYFTVCAKNYLLLQAKKTTKQNKIIVHYDDRNSTEELTKYNYQQQTVPSTEKLAADSEFFILLKEELVLWKDKSKNEKERTVLEGINKIFDNIDNLNIYDKKAIFFYLREITDLNGKQLHTLIDKIRKRYEKFKKNYYSS